eukprot:2473625-Rhodomonas_salina.2
MRLGQLGLHGSWSNSRPPNTPHSPSHCATRFPTDDNTRSPESRRNQRRKPGFSVQFVAGRLRNAFVLGGHLAWETAPPPRAPLLLLLPLAPPPEPPPPPPAPHAIIHQRCFRVWGLGSRAGVWGLGSAQRKCSTDRICTPAVHPQTPTDTHQRW